MREREREKGGGGEEPQTFAKPKEMFLFVLVNNGSFR